MSRNIVVFAESIPLIRFFRVTLKADDYHVTTVLHQFICVDKLLMPPPDLIILAYLRRRNTYDQEQAVLEELRRNRYLATTPVLLFTTENRNDPLSPDIYVGEMLLSRERVLERIHAALTADRVTATVTHTPDLS